MSAIHIPRLIQLPEQQETVEFRQLLPPLDTLTPVQGWLRVIHQGNYLEVAAEAETIVTLTCHRCLQQYNYRLAIAPKEIIWLQDSDDQLAELPFDQDLSVEDLVESLPLDGHFDRAVWLYEQLCLGIPQRQLCDQACSGIAHSGAITERSTDRRWASLESLKDRFPS
jgi:uncharacterized protein